MRRLGLRALAFASAALLTLVVWAVPAGAHALAVSSDPPAGATLAQAPATVTVTFGEPPDPRLSALRVLDSSGTDHTVGKTLAVPGNPRALEVHLGKLANGVYTVSWRTVSEVDGHLAAGQFAFGVGVAPTSAAMTGGLSAKNPNPSVASVAARWLLYAGLMFVVGAALVALVCTRVVPTRLLLLSYGGSLIALFGAAGITVDAANHAHLALSRLLGSSLGHQLEWRVIPTLVAAAFGAVALGFRHDPRRSTRLLAAAGVAGLVAMWGDVEASHAAATRTLRLAQVGDQWAHFAAAGVWLGGLAAFLMTIGLVAPSGRLRAARRLSRAALISVAVIAATGFQRAFNEVRTWHSLVHTGFGQDVLIKIALLVALIGLGALNRYRSLPLLERSSTLLHVVGRTELVLLGGVLAVTGLLQGLAPPASVAQPPRPLVLHGSDLGTTVRVTLTILPGSAGFNEFTLEAVDYDSGKPVAATASLRFTLPARPDLGSSTLDLRETKPGLFAAGGPNLSIDGAWTIDVDLGEATGGVEIPFTVTPGTPPERIVLTPEGSGLPTLYTLELSGGRSVQTYLDPGHPGFNEFHVTFLGPDGNEIPMHALVVSARAGTGGSPVTLTVRRLDTIGHFVADLPGAVPGKYLFHVTGTTATSDTITGTITIPVR